MIRFEGINTPVFRSIQREHNTTSVKDDKHSITNVTTLPDIKMPVAVNIPAGYTKLGVTKLYNGLEIHNYKLSNGLKVSIVPMDTNFTMVRTFVNTGAVNEYDNQRGISHFLEHMAFNGTLGADGYKKLSTGDVFRIVGNIGGDTNASTNFALTDYYIQAPIFYDSDLEEIISIQGAMMNNLALPENMIEKERGPVISEINMYTDYPDSTAYSMAIKNLYNLNTTSDDYVAGRVENIKKLTRDDVLNYYRNNYYPANMYTTLAGDVNPDEAIKLIAKHFHTQIQSPVQRRVDKLTPINKPVRKDFISPKTKEMTGYIAFNGPENNNMKDMAAIQFIAGLLTANSNSTLKKHFINQNISINIGLEKVSTRPEDGQAVFLEFTAPDEKTDFILNTIYDELANFKKPSEKEVAIIKKGLLTGLDKMLQAPGETLDLLGNFYFKFGDNGLANYENTIKSITAEDIERCVHKYFDLNKASIAIAHPEIKQANEITSPAFTGLKEKKVIKPENLNIYNFSNNYEAASYDTHSDYRYFKIKINKETCPDSPPGASLILDLMLNNGTENINDKLLTAIFYSKLITNTISADADSITIKTHADKNDMKLAIELAKNQLLHPNMSEDNLKNAKKLLREYLLTEETSAGKLIYNHEFPDSPLYQSTEKILDNIDKITLNDIKKLYNDILKNGTGTIAFTTAKDEPEYTKQVLSAISSLPEVKTKTHKLEKTFTPDTKPVVLTQQTNNSQAEIKIGFKYKTNDNLRDEIIFRILSSLLSKNAFNDLREKQQLAYHVNSHTKNCAGNTNMLFCNILTTTEDNETGEQMYDNLQKSINGYKKLIEDLKKGNFTDEELNAIKLEHKGNLLAATESDNGKTSIISSDLSSVYGPLSTNLKYSIIDTITKEEIIKAANYIFSQPPIYGITATKNTLSANTMYFKELEEC